MIQKIRGWLLVAVLLKVTHGIEPESVHANLL